MARLCVPVGGRVRKLRSVGGSSSPPLRVKVEERWSLDARSEGRFACSLMGMLKDQNERGVTHYLQGNDFPFGSPVSYRNG